MSNFNKVILMGNLTRDPKLSYLPSNMPVCEFGLAVNHRWRDKEGQQRDEVCFVDISMFGKGGETINQYMTKGKPILIEGRLKFDTWTGQDGTRRSKLSVVAENFRFVGSRQDSGGTGAGGGAPAVSYEGSQVEGPPRPNRAPVGAPMAAPAGGPTRAPESDAPPMSAPPPEAEPQGSYDNIPF